MVPKPPPKTAFKVVQPDIPEM